MPNILDNVVRVIRPQKSLDDIYRQLGRVYDGLRKRRQRREELYRRSWRLEETPDVFRNMIAPHFQSVDTERDIGNEIFYISRGDKGMDGFSRYNHTKKARESNDVYRDFYTQDFIDYAPTERQIRMDPLMYVDHPSRIVRNFARGLINGDIQ